MGEPALPEVEAAVLAIVQGDPDVQQANGILAVHMGPEEIVAALSLEFEDRLAAPEIEACVERLETKVRAAKPEISALFIKPQATGTWQKRSMLLQKPLSDRPG